MQKQFRHLLRFVAWAFVVQCTGAQTSAVKSLLSGSISWAIDPAFVHGERFVDFTVLTAFEIRAQDEIDCTFKLNQEIQCSSTAMLDRFGRICIDRYARNWGTNRMRPVATYTGWCPVDDIPVDAPVLGGSRNNFVVMDKRNINGLNVVFGKKKVTAQVDTATTGLVAYLMLDPEAESKPTGVLLPQCSTDLLSLSLPCAVNAFFNLSAEAVDTSATSGQNSTSSTGSSPDEFGLFKEEICSVDGCDFTSPSINIYWRGFSQPPEEFAKEGSSLAKITPALETFVPLCAADPADHAHNCTSALNPLTNYFSPVPHFPPFVEVAVTPHSQVGETSRAFRSFRVLVRRRLFASLSLSLCLRECMPVCAT